MSVAVFPRLWERFLARNPGFLDRQDRAEERAFEQRLKYRYLGEQYREEHPAIAPAPSLFRRAEERRKARVQAKAREYINTLQLQARRAEHAAAVRRARHG